MNTVGTVKKNEGKKKTQWKTDERNEVEFCEFSEFSFGFLINALNMVIIVISRCLG